MSSLLFGGGKRADRGLPEGSMCQECLTFMAEPGDEQGEKKKALEGENQNLEKTPVWSPEMEKGGDLEPRNKLCPFLGPLRALCNPLSRIQTSRSRLKEANQIGRCLAEKRKRETKGQKGTEKRIRTTPTWRMKDNHNHLFNKKRPLKSIRKRAKGTEVDAGKVVQTRLSE